MHFGFSVQFELQYYRPHGLFIISPVISNFVNISPTENYMETVLGLHNAKYLFSVDQAIYSAFYLVHLLPDLRVQERNYYAN